MGCNITINFALLQMFVVLLEDVLWNIWITICVGLN